MRRWLATLVLVLCANIAVAAEITPSPASLGKTVADAWLATPAIMTYRTDEATGVHYAEAAVAYGAIRLAHASDDPRLYVQVARRYANAVAEPIVNTRNHVDVNVFGLWPLALAEKGIDPDDKAFGLSFADGQWRDIGADGLTREARYWIDDLWMIGMLQVQAWRDTHDPKYLDRAALVARLYVAKLQEPNGLFHHGPEAPFFWGRGNGWVAAALAEILSELPRSHPAYPAILAGYHRMMAALLHYQAPNGLWRQLIDRPDAWEETSASAMFGFALASGVKNGLLTDPAYRLAYEKAWTALAKHVGADGKLDDVCVGTAQSKDAAYYLGRPKVVGDFHGQAPMLWFAAVLVEMGER